MLGLAPNAARLSIRFWETAPALELARRIQRHFEDLRVARGPTDPEHLSLFRLLTACAVQGKADNIPPNLGGEVMRAILQDRCYPATLLNAAVQRSRAEQRVTYARAAILKAWLNLHAGRAVQMEKRVGEILDNVDDFPRHLTLPDQGRFALGYYHQRQAFFARDPKPDDASNVATSSASHDKTRKEAP